MPRRHRAAREREGPPEPSARPLSTAPEWAVGLHGFTVRAVSGEKGKAYRCPGCEQEIRPGIPHLVVVADDDLQGRRHWHTPCWRRELRRRGVPGG
jgi:hypothetical protein